MVSASGGLCPPDPLLESLSTPQHPHSKNLPTPLSIVVLALLEALQGTCLGGFFSAANAWFIEIALVCTSVCVCVCLCVRPRSH